MNASRFGKGAIGKVNQDLPTAQASVTSVSNRVSALEGQNLDNRIDTLEAQITALLSHTHDYEDDNGTITVTKTTESN